MAGFVWGAGGAQLTPEQIAAKEKVAQALMERGSDTSPVQHWSQGANRVLQGLMGGYDSRVADEASKANAEENKALIASLLTGGTAPVATTTAPAPMASNPPAMTGGTPSPVAMAPSVSNKIYSANEPSPLDPPSGKDRDLAIRTVYGEDPGSSALGVANVIRNRAVAGKFGGDTIPGVVLAKNQFEPWNNDAAKARMMALDPNSAEYKRLGGVVDEAYTGLNDPTNGATHFFAPKAQAALGRQVPSWGMQGGQDIGVHRFFGGAANPTTVATNAVPPAAGTRPGAPVQPSQTTWGDKEAEAAGLYEAPATVAQRSVAPGALADPAALPQNAQPAQYVAPGTGEVIAPAPAASAARPSISPATAYAIIANPRANEGTKKIAALMLQQQFAQEGVTHVDAGNSIVVMDKKGNEVRRIAKGEPNKGPEFGVISKDEDGKEVYGWKDARTQSVTPYAPPSSQPAAPAMITGPDGTPIPIPAGVDKKTFKQHVSAAAADAAVGKKTEVQQKADQFATRMELAEKNVTGVEGEALGASGAVQQIAGGVPVVGSALQGTGYQKYSQAKSQFITALLRQESGAAIGKEEFNRYDKEFFPQPGDGPDVIAQKRESRAAATMAMRRGAGPGSKPAESAARPAAPAAGEVKDGYRFKGGDPSKRESWERVS